MSESDDYPMIPDYAQESIGDGGCFRFIERVNDLMKLDGYNFAQAIDIAEGEYSEEFQNGVDCVMAILREFKQAQAWLYGRTVQTDNTALPCGS